MTDHFCPDCGAPIDFPDWLLHRASYQGSPIHTARRLGSVTGEGRPAKPYEWSGEALRESGPSESAHAQMRRAANMMGNKRREDFADELAARAGIDADTAIAVTDHLTDGPPPAMRVVRHDGTAAPALRDDEPITEENSFRNLSEARRAISNFRNAQAIEAQQLLYELGQRQEQQAAPGQAVEPPFPPTSPAPQPAAPPAPQPQQPDPAVQREAAAAQAHQVANSIAQMSAAEAALFTDIQRHDAAAVRAFPELQWSPDQLEQLAQTNPERLAQINSEYQKNLQARQQLAGLTAQRQHAQAQIAQRQQANLWKALDVTLRQNPGEYVRRVGAMLPKQVSFEHTSVAELPDDWLERLIDDRRAELKLIELKPEEVSVAR